jgi:hypothetical protein
MQKLDQLFTLNTSMQNTLTASTTELKGQLTSVENKVLSIDDKISNVSIDLAHATQSISELENKVDLLENKNRENNIIIFGISEASNIKDENICDIIIQLCADKLNINISINDINKCHRFGTFKLNKKRPVLLSLVHNRIKSNIFSNVKNLKGTGISICDDLTPTARAHKKIVYDALVQAQNTGIKNVKRGKNFLIIDGKKIYLEELSKVDWILKYTKVPSSYTPSVSNPPVIINPNKTAQGNESAPPTPSKTGGRHSTRILSQTSTNR